MRNGLYKAHFGIEGITHLAIVSVRDGIIIGADVTHLITGSYQRKGNRFKGRIVLDRHCHRDDVPEIAYLDHIEADFEGVGGHSFGEFTADVAEKKGLKVKASFQWISGVG